MTAPHTRTPVLLNWPAVPAWRIGGQIWLDRKFKDGVDISCDQWPGRIRVVMEVAELAQVPSFGAYRWTGSDERFDLALIEAGQHFSREHLAGVDILVASADSPGKRIAPALCREAGVACVTTIEYTLATRLDMLAHAPMTRVKRFKTLVWLLMNEWRLRATLRGSDSIQANGLPAFNQYARSRPGNLLYFDTRLPAASVIAEPDLERRIDAMRSGAPLRMAFSGRLIAGKGADALIPLASRLKRLGLRFHLDIYGSGDLEPAIAAGIVAEGLADQVTLHGPVDFATALMPTLKQQVDLFICCHRQGDPSCTYAETAGCGVPIVGFANESLKSLVEGYGIGWVVPMDALDALAALVARLDGNRADVADRSRAARRFGMTHSFESTFQQRNDHCLDVVGRRRAAPAGVQAAAADVRA